MHEFAWHQLSYRQETLWSPSWEQSLSLLPPWIVHERVRQVGSRLTAEVESRLFGFFSYIWMKVCLPELGVVGELAWLFCTAAAAACAAFTAVLAAYRLASSWNLPIFFLYRIRLLPNQLDTCVRRAEEGGGAEESDVKQSQYCALSSVIVSRCHVWVHQVPNSQPLQQCPPGTQAN